MDKCVITFAKEKSGAVTQRLRAWRLKTVINQCVEIFGMSNAEKVRFFQAALGKGVF